MYAGKCAITCSVSDTGPDETDIRESIEGYIETSNVITNYELIITN